MAVGRSVHGATALDSPPSGELRSTRVVDSACRLMLDDGRWVQLRLQGEGKGREQLGGWGLLEYLSGAGRLHDRESGLDGGDERLLTSDVHLHDGPGGHPLSFVVVASQVPRSLCQELQMPVSPAPKYLSTLILCLASINISTLSLSFQVEVPCACEPLL